MGFSHTSFSVFEIPSFEILSFVIPSKTFLVLSFSVSCVNPWRSDFIQLLVIIVLIPLSVWYLFTHRKHLGEMKGKVDMKDWTITVSMNHFSLPLHSSVDTWKILHASPSPHANLLFCLLHFSTLECFKSFFPNTSVFCDFCWKRDSLDDFWTLVRSDLFVLVDWFH